MTQIQKILFKYQDKKYADFSAKLVPNINSWAISEALVKQWDATLPYIQNKKLAPRTHKKAIQKACESFRISQEKKEFLKQIKVK